MTFLGVSDDARKRDLIPIGLWLLATLLSFLPAFLVLFFVGNNANIAYWLVIVPVFGLVGGFIVKPKLGVAPIVLMAPAGTFLMSLPAVAGCTVDWRPCGDLWEVAIFILAFGSFFILTIFLVLGQVARRWLMRRSHRS